MPMMIGKLTSLQTLPFFIVGEDKDHKIEELGSLSKLRGKLMIYNLKQVKDKKETEKANISRKLNIHELRFCWDMLEGHSTAEDTTSINHKDVLEGLKPHGSLKVLKLEKFKGQNFASWMMSGRDAQLLQNSVKIELFECTGCEQVPPFGHLLHLEVIRMYRLSNLKRIGPEFCGGHSVVNPDHDHDNDGIISGNCSGAATTATAKAMAVVFPTLRELHLENMPNIEEWCGLGVSSSSSDTTMLFPLLECLFIKNCPELTTIPGHLLSLQELICGDNPNMHFPTHRPYLRIYGGSKTKMGVLLIDFLEKSSKTLRKLSSNISSGLPPPSAASASASTSTSASATATIEEEVDDDDTKYHPNPKHYPFLSLVSLTLLGWERVKYLPDQLQHLNTLRDLSIKYFGLEALSEWLDAQGKAAKNGTRLPIFHPSTSSTFKGHEMNDESFPTNDESFSSRCTIK
ncbi:putative disease resistance RPP13-like protein 1 [Camellia lanceoleosa]|uniref:Disease resistance RPP13-like protein 1 n=1 Tax=Camellia lanceoleosa TaxID=1840588 RepID=A0ACC0GWC2_9ERIC|nr:putative disease resistance RPP13-like protein 1 [Camellia lanceoleosa]